MHKKIHTTSLTKVLASCVFVLISYCSFAQPTEIRLVTLQDYPPFSYKKDGKLHGLLVEIVEQVSKSMPNYTITLTPLAWQKVSQHEVPANTLGFLGSYFKPVEWPNIYPYSYPIYHEQMAVVCNGDKNLQESAFPHGFEKIKMGHVRNYVDWIKYGSRLRELGKLNAFEFPDPELTLLGVVNEVVDCALFEVTTYNSVRQNLINKNSIQEKNKLRISTLLSRTSIHIGYYEKPMSDKEKQFIRDFDTAFYSLLLDNQLAPIYSRYGVSH